MIKDKFLGVEYEYQLIKLIFGEEIHEDDQQKYIDTRFGERIIAIVDDTFFSDTFCKFTINIIKKYHEKYRSIPTYKQCLLEASFLNEQASFKKQLIKFLSEDVYLQSIDNSKWIKEKFETYLKQQMILDFCETTRKSILSGEIGHEKINNFLLNFKEVQKKLFQVERPVEVTENIDYLTTKEGYYVPLGWGEDFDKTFNFRQGSLAVGIIPTGVGKTTSAVVTAVHNFLLGKKVLLLIFEDDYSDIFKKIYAKLSGFAINNIKNNFETVTDIGVSKVIEARDNDGRLVIMKLSQTKSTTNDVRNLIDYFEATYGKLYLLVLDYLDCLNSPFDKKYVDEYQEQGDVIVDLLELVSDLEYYIPCLTYIQSGRAGLNKALVESSNASGSIKRAFKAPQLFTVSKTIRQKSSKQANVLIEKNRKGDSGIYYKDVDYDNTAVEIDISNAHIYIVEDEEI